jgi:hypothetical protein
MVVVKPNRYERAISYQETRDHQSEQRRRPRIHTLTRSLKSCVREVLPHPSAGELGVREVCAYLEEKPLGVGVAAWLVRRHEL